MKVLITLVCNISSFELVHSDLSFVRSCYFYFYCTTNKYEKRLLLRCIHHFKSDLINNMDHMRISGTEINFYPYIYNLVKTLQCTPQNVFH